MVVSEIAGWATALVLIAMALLFAPDYYTTTILTGLLYKILMTHSPIGA
jgi:hypothetical protein